MITDSTTLNLYRTVTIKLNKLYIYSCPNRDYCSRGCKGEGQINQHPNPQRYGKETNIHSCAKKSEIVQSSSGLDTKHVTCGSKFFIAVYLLISKINTLLLTLALQINAFTYKPINSFILPSCSLLLCISRTLRALLLNVAMWQRLMSVK